MLNKILVMGSILLLSSCHSGFGSSDQDVRTSAQNLRTKLVVDLPATTNPEFNTQKIFSVADQSEFSTQIKLKNDNGFVLWSSTNKKPLASQGKTIENLKPTKDLPANTFAYQTRYFPVFNAKGDGFFVWLGPPTSSYPDPPPPFDSFSLRNIQGFKSTETVTNIPGVVHEGDMDEQGRGSLYWFQYLNSRNPMNPTFDLWRYPIENYQMQSQPELLESNLSDIPFIKTDGQGNGFRLQKKPTHSIVQNYLIQP